MELKDKLCSLEWKNHKMKKLNPVDRIILKNLLNSDSGLNIVTLWRRYQLAPTQIGLAINRFVAMKIVEYDGVKAKITYEGKKWALKERFAFPLEDKPWRKCPEEFKQPQLPVNTYYAPLIYLLDKRAFLKQWKSRRK